MDASADAVSTENNSVLAAAKEEEQVKYTKKMMAENLPFKAGELQNNYVKNCQPINHRV